QFEAPASPDLSGLTMDGERAVRVAVALQRALDLPPELFAVDHRGRIPANPARDRAEILCTAHPTKRTIPVAGSDIPVITLRCVAYLAAGDHRALIATADVEPSATLKLESVVDDELDAGPLSLDEAKKHVWPAMMTSAIEALPSKFALSIYRPSFFLQAP